MAPNNTTRIDALEHQFEKLLQGQEALMKSQSKIVSILDGIAVRIKLQIVEELKELNQVRVKDTAPPLIASSGACEFIPGPSYGKLEGGILSPSSNSTTSTDQFSGKSPELLSASHTLPEIDFPKFNGDNARSWVMKCNIYFRFYPMSDYDKIMIASMHMEGVADDWYFEYIDGKEDMMWWEKFCELVLGRFLNVEGINLVGRFNKLEQVSSVSEYFEEFEELKAYMVTTYRSLTEDYYIKSFISGLKEEIGLMVDMLNPGSLLRARQLAIKQERMLLVMNKGHKLTQKAYISAVWKLEEGSKVRPSTYQGEKMPPVRRLTQTELELRNKKNLCCNCDETYRTGHKCKRLFVIMMEDAELEEDLALEETTNGDQETIISLNALPGHQTPDIMKLSGKVGQESLTVILGSGSPYSFLDPNAAKRVGCEVKYTNPFVVTLPGGRKVECNSKCSKLELELGECKIITPVRIMKLGECDMLIGGDLLRHLGPITFDFRNHKVKFSRNGFRCEDDESF